MASADAAASRPIRLALVDDYEIVLIGVANMFEAYRDRIEVVELDIDRAPADTVDIALYDSFAQPEADHSDIDVLLESSHADRVVVYTWAFEQHVIDAAIEKGVSGYLTKTLPASELVDSLERIHAGEIVVSAAPGRSRAGNGLQWPGRVEGLTERESEIVALITQGHSNAEIAEMTYLSINSIKSYIRSSYRKMGVSSRTQAVLWGIEHGFRPPSRRLDSWR